MQTRPEVSWANCGMCAVECRDTSSGPAIPEWSCEKKRRVLTLPRALHPEARPCGQVLREIELAVSVQHAQDSAGLTADCVKFRLSKSFFRSPLRQLRPADQEPDSTVLNSESKLLSSCWRYAHRK